MSVSLLPLSLVAVLAAVPSGVWAGVDFNREVRPILADNCFACHGPDAANQKADLRLDDRDAALRPAKSGVAAIVPGKLEESEMVKRIFATNADDLMPPESAHKKLTAEQKETLRKWIAEGAEYQGHWAFIPPERPPVPAVAAGDASPIDAFILDRLAKEGLSALPAASKETLIRRVALDLTGLPPSPAEVDAFLADTSPDAYGKAVDRLLESPRYGEHMAAQWMDFARYADSNGFQSDTTREQWLWRNWVIDAFNRNVPYDTFTVEQLAGDLLPQATPEQITATGFHRNHRLNGEGGRIVEEWFAENVIDRVETTGQTWMGLTLGCARCHDHKYDPISQKEFYQFFAYFNSIEESGVMDDFGGGGTTRMGGNSAPVITLPAPAEQEQLAKLKDAVKEAAAVYDTALAALPAQQAAWEHGFREQVKDRQDKWKLLASASVKSTGGAVLTAQLDDTWLAGGPNPAHDSYEITAPVAAGTFSGLKLEALPDPSLPAQSLGRYPNGNFVLTGVEAEIIAPGLKEPLEAQFTFAEADYEQKGWEVEYIVKDRPKKGKGSRNKQGWAVDGPTKKDARTAIFVCAPLTIPDGATIRVTLRHDALEGHNMGRFRLSTSSQPPAVLRLKGGAIPAAVLTALELPADKRTAPQQEALTKFFRDNTDNPGKKAQLALEAARKALTDFEDNLPTVMVMKESAKPRDAFILVRGEYDKPGDKVIRALPAALPPMAPDAPNNRLGLAQWLVSGNHPLTARVWVNRQWEKFFGTGLVKTSENFGVQADFPSHPELLDWLATEFVRLKWDMKAMQKVILMSDAYRRSSQVTPVLLERDPENRLLARGPRIRLSGEALRDQALYVSGLLVEKTGGPGVRPYMPNGIWDETSVYGNMRNYQPDKGEGLYRRTLYTIWKRTAAPPTMLLFDSPSREICTVKRSRTNTPLQALALLNEVTYVEAARQLGTRMMKEGGASPEDRITWAFRTVTSRPPAPDEIAVLGNGYRTRLARYQNDPEAARQLLKQGSAPADGTLDAAELAAYTVTANVLLNLDEVVTRE